MLFYAFELIFTQLWEKSALASFQTSMVSVNDLLTV